jgi:hypothetical protein
MKARTLIVGLVLVVLTAATSGGCSSASGSSLASDAGSGNNFQGFADGGDSGSGGTASSLYCFFEYQGAQRCVGWGGLPLSECTQVNGTVVPSCPSAGMAGCCYVPPSYEQCWYCPSDPSQLESACQTIGSGKWTPGTTTCGDAGSSSGGADGSSGVESGAPSPYDTACSSSSMTCPSTPLICQTFTFGGGAITGYACTQTCTTTADCMAPSDAAVQCLPFTTGSFCVITCDATSGTGCPASLQCVANQGQQGICVSP